MEAQAWCRAIDPPPSPTLERAPATAVRTVVSSADPRGRIAESRDQSLENVRVSYEIRLEQSVPGPIAVIRRRVGVEDLPKVIPAGCGTVWEVVRARSIAGAGRHVAVYLDDRINLEVGVELEAPFGGHGEVADSATPGGPVAATTHRGPYGRLHEAHEAIRQWCSSHGRGLAGPFWEIYGHWREEWNRDPSRITTDVYYLLDKGGA